MITQFKNVEQLLEAIGQGRDDLSFSIPQNRKVESSGDCTPDSFFQTPD